MLLKLITDNEEARNFLNSVPYPEYVPEGFPAITPVSFILGVYVPKMSGLKLVGAFPFNRLNDGLQMHACFLKEYRGKFAVNAAKQAFEWVWSNTLYEKIYGTENTKLTNLFASMCGAKKNNGMYEVCKWAIL